MRGWFRGLVRADARVVSSLAGLWFVLDFKPSTGSTGLKYGVPVGLDATNGSAPGAVPLSNPVY